MIGFTPDEVLRRVGNLLLDPGQARWTEAELLRWLGDGLRELTGYVPYAGAVMRTLTLSEGAVQVLPSGEYLVDIPSSMVNRVDKNRLDAEIPGWMDEVVVDGAFEHFAQHESMTNHFLIYPPAEGGEQIQALIRDTTTFEIEAADADSVLPVDRIYLPAMVDYVMARAHLKHSRSTAADKRGRNAYNRFLNALGVSYSVDTSTPANETEVPS